MFTELNTTHINKKTEIFVKQKNMKARKTLFLFLVTIFSLNIYAQLKVKPNGKTIIGLDRTGDDSNNILSASIFGTGGEYRYGSKIAFGDFGTYGFYSWNAFIGEYGNYDSDRLWLHGNNGIYLTYSNGDYHTRLRIS